MRYLLLLSFVLSAFCSEGKKDPCKRITTSTDSKSGALTSKSPDLKNITVIKQYGPDTFFALLLHFTDVHDHFETFGASVAFEDGTVIADESVRVVCTQEASVIVSGNISPGGGSSGKYVLQGFFRITDENAGVFMLQRIKKITLHNAVRLIPWAEANKVMNYVGCLK